jgi:parallel beta-helix repeat protein
VEYASFDIIWLSIHDSSPKISSCSFSSRAGLYAIVVNGGSPLVEGNTINCVIYRGIWATSGSPVFLNNRIVGSGYEFGVDASDHAYFSGNEINHCYTGVTARGQTTFEANTIINCADTGLSSEDNTVTIKGNYIANNKVGVSGSGDIQSNTITGNKIGIQYPTSTGTLKNNNIFNNTKNNFVLDASQDFDATNNWWGTTDTQAISQTIRDYKDDFNLGTVNFVPFLTSPSSSAPSSPNSQATQSPATPPPVTPTSSPSTNPFEPTYTPTESTPTPTSPASIGDTSNTGNLLPFDLLTTVVVAIVALGVASVIILVVTVDRRFKK